MPNSSVFYTPRFSYAGSETVICTCPGVPVPWCTSSAEQWCTRVVYQGGYTRGVPGRAIPGTTQPPRGEPSTSEAGPGSPMGAGVGGYWGRACSWDGGRGRLQDHPSGARSVPCRVPPCPGPLECPPTAKGARIDLKSLKVSQNGIVSPKYH